MRFARFTVPALLIAAPFVPGCLPNDMPAYTNNGKTVVLMTEGEKGQTLWTYDIQTGVASAHRSPGKGKLKYARMLGDQVWVEWEAGCERFDPAKKEFVPPPEGFGGRDWLRRVIPASHEGKKSLFLPPEDTPDDPNEKIPYTVYSFPEMKKQATTRLNQVIPAGGFWWVSLRTRGIPSDEMEAEYIEVFNDAGKRIVSIEPEEAHKLRYTPGRFPGYARLGEDGKVLFLAFGEQGYYTFGVFDTTSGKFLWGGKSAGGAMAGNPLVRKTEVWSLELMKGLALVRHRPGDAAEARKDKHETIMEYPVEAEIMAGQYTPSPDASRFLMEVPGNPSSLLLFIPIREGVTAKDVVRVELRD
jgi:hypothetical protein